MRRFGLTGLQESISPLAEQRLRQALIDLDLQESRAREVLDQAETAMTILQEQDGDDPVVLLLEAEQVRRLGQARAAWCRARSAAEQGRLDLRVLGCLRAWNEQGARERHAG